MEPGGDVEEARHEVLFLVREHGFHDAVDHVVGVEDRQAVGGAEKGISFLCENPRNYEGISPLG